MSTFLVQKKDVKENKKTKMPIRQFCEMTKLDVSRFIRYVWQPRALSKVKTNDFKIFSRLFFVFLEWRYWQNDVVRRMLLVGNLECSNIICVTSKNKTYKSDFIITNIKTCEQILVKPTYKFGLVGSHTSIPRLFLKKQENMYLFRPVGILFLWDNFIGIIFFFFNGRRVKPKLILVLKKLYNQSHYNNVLYITTKNTSIYISIYQIQITLPDLSLFILIFFSYLMLMILTNVLDYKEGYPTQLFHRILYTTSSVERSATLFLFLRSLYQNENTSNL